jgi:hypothetical protein
MTIQANLHPFSYRAQVAPGTERPFAIERHNLTSRKISSQARQREIVPNPPRKHDRYLAVSSRTAPIVPRIPRSDIRATSDLFSADGRPALAQPALAPLTIWRAGLRAGRDGVPMSSPRAASSPRACRHSSPRIRKSAARIWGCDCHASRATTSSAIDSEAVSPGDSMPNRLTRYGMPCSAGPAIKKSACGSPGPRSFGRMPE